jgi:hypothetical protein
VARVLPDREELWRRLRAAFTDARDISGGFVGTDRYGNALSIMLTPKTWQEYVVTCEIRCRNDYGVDADNAGDGSIVAIDDLDETLATLDPDEKFVVLDAHDLTGSTRAELPPVRGTAAVRKAERIRLRGGGTWYATRPPGRRSPSADESRDRD